MPVVASFLFSSGASDEFFLNSNKGTLAFYLEDDEENFVLQNGGSFVTAARNFLEISEGKNLEEFKQQYSIWDFGSNFLTEKRETYPHDNFVNNMNEVGYEKMKEALKNYLLQTENKEFFSR